MFRQCLLREYIFECSEQVLKTPSFAVMGVKQQTFDKSSPAQESHRCRTERWQGYSQHGTAEVVDRRTAELIVPDSQCHLDLHVWRMRDRHVI